MLFLVFVLNVVVLIVVSGKITIVVFFAFSLFDVFVCLFVCLFHFLSFTFTTRSALKLHRTLDVQPYDEPLCARSSVFNYLHFDVFC